MSNKLQPIAQSFLVCREIFTDEVSRTRLLMHPFCRLNLPGFPATFPVCLFIQLTGGHGTYPYFPDDLQLSARHVRRNPGIPSDSASFLPK